MIETIICHNCKTANNFVNLHCSKCNHLIRDRVINIDLWKSLFGMIDSPQDMLKEIILAEHKNFIIALFFLISFRHIITALLITPYVGITSLTFLEFRIIASIVLILLLYIALSIALKAFINKEITTFKSKDSFSLFIYGQTPIVYSLVILFVFELILFGEFLFSIQPSPLEIKPMFFYLFSVLEVIVLVWALLNSSQGLRIIGINKLSSLLLSIVLIVGPILLSFLTFYFFRTQS